MNLGNILKLKREEKGLTQKQLAELVGCAEITIRQYENGSREPRSERLELIANKLDTTVSLLMISASMDDNNKEVNIVEPDLDEIREEVAALRYSLNKKGLTKTRDYMRDLMGNDIYKVNN